MSFFGKFPKYDYDITDISKVNMPDLFRNAIPEFFYVNSAIAYQKYIVQEQRPDQVSQELYGSPEYHWTFFVINEHLKDTTKWPLSYQSLIDFINDKYLNSTIRLYRDAGDAQDYNSVASKFPIGSTLTGGTSGATATVVSRDVDLNQIEFTYTNEFTFNENEVISGVDYLNAAVTINDKFDIRTGPNSIHHFEDADGNEFNNYDNLLNSAFIVTNFDYERNLNDQNAEIRVIRKAYIEEFSVNFRKAVND